MNMSRGGYVGDAICMGMLLFYFMYIFMFVLVSLCVVYSEAKDKFQLRN